jgi:hypothetical protein
VGEPFGRRLWLGLLAVVLVAACLDSYGISKWPMADDEVPTLVELGLYQVPGNAFSVPAVQLERLPRALPVYYAFQRAALRALPHDVPGLRIPALVCAILVSGLALSSRRAGGACGSAAALAIVLNLSQPFVYLAQIDRFYSMPLLMLALTLVAICISGRDVPVDAGDRGPGDADRPVAQRDRRLLRADLSCRRLRVHRRPGPTVSGRSDGGALPPSACCSISFSFARWSAAGTAPATRRRFWCPFAAHAGVPSLALAASGSGWPSHGKSGASRWPGRRSCWSAASAFCS